jgi:hypothetical protein
MSGKVILAEAGTRRLAPGQVGRQAAGLVLQVLDAGEQDPALQRAERAVPRQQQQEWQKDNVARGID